MIRQWIGRLVLALLGWKIDGMVPDLRRAVVIFAPHTSTFDWLYLLMAGWSLRRSFRYIVRDDVYANPFQRPFLKYTGAIPLDNAFSMVRMSTRLLTENEDMLLVLSPEGALRKTDGWRSGFYFIAEKADAPIVPIGLDYGKRRVVIGVPLNPTGDLSDDIVHFASFYEGMQGRHPEQFGPVQVSKRSSAHEGEDVSDIFEQRNPEAAAEAENTVTAAHE